MKTAELFDLSKTIAEPLLRETVYPWEALPRIADFIRALGATLDPAVYNDHGGDIWIAKDARIAKTASITGPCIIDREAEIRHCAFIRGSVIIGKGATVGNSSELKNAILFDKAQTPHYNYVGDSILGYKAHIGAAGITSNLKSDKTNIVIHSDPPIETGLRKIGAMIGDEAEIGCGSVLNPGTVIGRGSTVYPLSSVRGVVPAHSIYKKQGEIAEKR